MKTSYKNSIRNAFIVSLTLTGFIVLVFAAFAVVVTGTILGFCYSMLAKLRGLKEGSRRGTEEQAPIEGRVERVVIID